MTTMMMSEEMMMMTTSEEDRFRAMAEEGVDRSYDENLPIFRSEITESLGEMETEMERPTYEQDHLYAFSQLDWAEGLEDSTIDVIKSMTGVGDYCRRGTAHFAAKDPALAETLRGKAAWSYATRAELVEVAAGAHRLRGTCLRVLAGAEKEDVVYLAAVEYLAHVARNTPHSGDSIPVFPDEAVADQVHAAAVAGARDSGAQRFVEGFAERGGRLRRGAAEFGGEDQVLTQELMKLAATVEALCEDDTEVFVHKVVSSPYWRAWRSKNRGR